MRKRFSNESPSDVSPQVIDETVSGQTPMLEEVLFGPNQLKDCAEFRSTIRDTCKCAACKGATIKNVRRLSTRCKWQRAHLSYMTQHGVNLKSVASRYELLNFGTPRQRHMLAVVLERNHLLDKSRATDKYTVINLSQSIHRCTMTKKVYLPVITPGSLLYHLGLQRLLKAEESFLMMGFDLRVLDVGCLSAQELASLAGNAMHVRAVAVAMLIGLSFVDPNKFCALTTTRRNSKLKGSQRLRDIWKHASSHIKKGRRTGRDAVKQLSSPVGAVVSLSFALLMDA